MDIREKLACVNEEIICLDGFDDAIIGVAHSQDGSHAIYSMEKIIEILMQDMDREMALEYFDYNIAGLRFAKNFPIYVVSDFTAEVG